MIVTEYAELDKCRNCPGCGGRPERLYVNVSATSQVIRQGYCTGCRTCYSAGRAWYVPRPAKPKPPSKIQPLRARPWSDPEKVAAFLADEYIPSPTKRDPGRAARWIILERDHYLCQIAWYGETCGLPADTVDHILPCMHGVDNRASNLRAACGPCNFRKGGIDQLIARSGEYEVSELTDDEIAMVAQLDAMGIRPEIGSREVKMILQHQGLPRMGTAPLAAVTTYRRARGAL